MESSEMTGERGDSCSYDYVWDLLDDKTEQCKLSLLLLVNAKKTFGTWQSHQSLDYCLQRYQMVSGRLYELELTVLQANSIKYFGNILRIA